MDTFFQYILCGQIFLSFYVADTVMHWQMIDRC